MIIAFSLLILLTQLKRVSNAVSDVPNDRSVDMFFGDSFCQNIIQQDLTNAVKSVCTATSKGITTSDETYRTMATRIETLERKLDAALVQMTNMTTIVKSCPTGYEYYQQENFCYNFNTECKNWTDARQICRNEGGDLISLTEGNFIFFRDVSQRKSGTCNHVWVGTTSISSPRRWNWLNGQAITAVFWAPGQPDYWLSNEHCGDLTKHANYFLNDDDCKNTRHFLCQWV